MRGYTILAVVTVVTLAVVSATSGYPRTKLCHQSCANVKCPKLRRRHCQIVMKPCSCCPVCASGIGRRCGSQHPPCMKYLWCIKQTITSIEAHRGSLPDQFKGVCGHVRPIMKRRRYRKRKRKWRARPRWMWHLKRGGH
ncbi:perlustrin-like [Haliotis rubra]|uniref:perlustrin-like n=1 Tax=Haliotis rubra TaxID=36100 RepID=UPI001EE6154D|nr:perlustrin-like [Haliotis rubra]